MKKCFLVLSIVFALAIGVPQVFAQATTQPGTITFYGTGWSADQASVKTTAPFVANGCPSTDAYLTNPSDPGNHAYQAALLAAFLAGKQVTLTVSGCYIGRPQIIGVTVYP